MPFLCHPVLGSQNINPGSRWISLFCSNHLDAGTREVRIHHSKLPHLPAKKPKCLIRNSLPSASSTVSTQLLSQRRIASLGKRAMSKSLSPRHFSYPTGWWLRYLPAEENYIGLDFFKVRKDTYQTTTVFNVWSVYYFPIVTFLLWMLATSSQKVQWCSPKTAVQLYFQCALIQLTQWHYKLFNPQYRFVLNYHIYWRDLRLLSIKRYVTKVTLGCWGTKVAFQDLDIYLQGNLFAWVQMVSSLIKLRGTEL